MIVTPAALCSLARQHGFRIVPPDPMIDPHFPDTFAPSGFHDLVWRATGVKGGAAVQPSAGIQWVYRHVDLGTVPYSPTHLLAFQMFVCLESHDVTQRRESLNRTFATLLEALAAGGINVTDLRVSVFDGHAREGWSSERDTMVIQAWEQAGLNRSQILPVKGPSLCALTRAPGDLAGPRSEIFARHPVLGFLEVATVVTEMWQVLRTGAMRPLPRQVTGFALGVERLQLFASESSDIVELIWDRSGSESMLTRGIEATHGASMAGLVKGLHAAMILRPQIVENTTSAYLARYRQLVRAIQGHQSDLGLDDTLMNALAENIGEGRFLVRNMPVSQQMGGVWSYLAAPPKRESKRERAAVA